MAPRPVLEKRLEAYFRAEIKARGGWAIKMLGIAGLPDRMVLMPGARIYFVELKAEGGRTSKIQQAVHRRLLALGFVVEVLTGRQEIDGWLELI